MQEGGFRSRDLTVKKGLNQHGWSVKHQFQSVVGEGRTIFQLFADVGMFAKLVADMGKIGLWYV